MPGRSVIGDGMKVSYDKGADAMYIKFQEGKYEVSDEVAEGIVIDYSKEGKVMAIEILDASKRFTKKAISDATVG